MKKEVKNSVLVIANVIEFFIANLIILVVAILCLNLIVFVWEMLMQKSSENVLVEFLEEALNLVIGIEFVKMLCNHKPGTIIEVLLFAIARKMIVEHLGVSEILMGVISIGVLFAIRMYLFIKSDA